MPTYTYSCRNKDCDFSDIDLDIVHKMSEHPLKVCPYCKEDKLVVVPVVNSGGIHYKGTGWFKTGGY